MNLTGNIRQPWLLGRYWLFSENSIEGKVFRRADTEADSQVFLYFFKEMWWVGEETGSERIGTKLRNGSSKQNRSHPPMHNWQEISLGLFGVKDSWQDCDLQLDCEVGLRSACNLDVRSKKGGEKAPGNKEGKVLGNYFQLPGRWSLGRRVSYILLAISFSFKMQSHLLELT